MPVGGKVAGSLISRFASKLKYPQLFFVTLTLFVVDLIVPDLFPFLDEILLGLLTILLGSWANDRGVDAAGSVSDVRNPPVKDITPKEPPKPPHPGEE